MLSDWDVRFDLAAHSIAILFISIFLSSLASTMILSLSPESGNVLVFLLSKEILTVLCYVGPLLLLYKVSSPLIHHNLGVTSEGLHKRSLVGIALGPVIAALWLASFILQWGKLPTYSLNLDFPTEFYRVSFSNVSIMEYFLFESLNQLLVAAGEEMLFRGFLQSNFEEAFGGTRGYFLTALLFALMHFMTPTYTIYQILLETFVGGLIVGYLFYRTKSLAGPIAAHYTGNLIERVLVVLLAFQ